MTRPLGPNPGTIVVAVGGNALSPPGKRVTISEQFAHTRTSLEVVVDLVRHGWKVAIVHGNGPQVGDALARNELAMHEIEPLPLGVLVAGTAGWIGYMIQQSLQNAFRNAGIAKDVLTVITQTEVDADDRQLEEATKPIGSVLTQERADRLRAVGVPLIQEKSGRIRRLAPSPAPIDVVEADAVRQLLDEGKLVVAAGGGGTPVYRTPGGMLEGVDAVVDKDRTAAILGSRIGATTLLILTNVDAVYRDWGTDRARRIDRLSLAEAVALDNTGSLGKGSMAPKIEAAIDFIRGGGRRAVIAALEDGMTALQGRTGTTITGERE